MGKMKKVIFIKNAVETLGYFSEQLAAEMERLGFSTYFVDYNRLFETVDGLTRFAGKGDTALVTFNFIGLRGEEVFETVGAGNPGESSLGESITIWEKCGIAVYNILVDHLWTSRADETPAALHIRNCKRDKTTVCGDGSRCFDYYSRTLL